MSALLRVLSLVCPLLFLLLACVQVLRAALGHIDIVFVQNWHRAVEQRIDALPTSTFYAIWFLIALVPLATLVVWYREFCSGKVLLLKTDAGHPLKIRQCAVNRFIHDSLSALPFVKEVRVRSRSRSGALAVQIRTWIAGADHIDNIQNLILDRVVSDTKRGFGVTKVIAPEILIEAINPAQAGEETQETAMPTPQAKPGRAQTDTMAQRDVEIETLSREEPGEPSLDATLEADEPAALPPEETGADEPAPQIGEPVPEHVEEDEASREEKKSP